MFRELCNAPVTVYLFPFYLFIYFLLLLFFYFYFFCNLLELLVCICHKMVLLEQCKNTSPYIGLFSVVVVVFLSMNVCFVYCLKLMCIYFVRQSARACNILFFYTFLRCEAFSKLDKQLSIYNVIFNIEAGQHQCSN